MKRDVDLIVIHCSATRADKPYSFEDLEKGHRARGFSKCGYHRYILRDGTIIKGREFEEIGAHVAGHNTHSIGICYEGGIKPGGDPTNPKHAVDTRTDEQTESLLKCIQEAINYSGHKIKRICGHRDLSPDTNGNGVVEPHEWVKQCPCFEAEPEYKYLLK
jgi:N-acetylmuramoyl-L-alanine amidase